MMFTPSEIVRRDAFLTSAGYDAMADLEETCEGSKSYYYEVHPSNIGDVVYLVYRGERYIINDPN